MKTKSPAVRIEPAIMEQLHNAFPDFTDSIIIQSAIMFALIFCCIPDSKRKIKKKKIRKRAQEIKSSKDNISYRISENILDVLGTFYANKKETLSKTKTIKCCLAEVLYLLEETNNFDINTSMNQNNSKKNETTLINLLGGLISKSEQERSTHSEKSSIRKLEYHENLAYRNGIKSGEVLKWIINVINKIMVEYDIDNYYEPFMGTGNVNFHCSPFSTETLNDKSIELVHLLNTLKEYPIEFIKKVISLDVSKKTFSEQKELLKSINKKYKGKQIRNKNEKIDKAVAYYYTLLLSVRGDCTCFRKNATSRTLHSKISILKQISERLQNTKIINEDSFDLLIELAESTDDKLAQTLIYFDPPYIGTEDYYKASENNETDFHEKLRDEIITLKDRGAKIIISYRATVTLHNKTTNNIGVQNKLDKLYMNQGFFMQPKRIEHYTKIKNEYVPDDQIEILLTSVQVDRSVPYDSNIADLIKELAK